MILDADWSYIFSYAYLYLYIFVYLKRVNKIQYNTIGVRSGAVHPLQIQYHILILEKKFRQPYCMKRICSFFLP